MPALLMCPSKETLVLRTSRQKDTDARWAKKNEETHFGYNNHMVVDNAHKWVRDYEVTCAEVHDSQVFIDLLSDNTLQRSDILSRHTTHRTRREG
ncbi:MAG: transposase [Gammaproteobacteria bacterium]|nr:transposase [Gammaproteobacteria bacterium]